MLEAYRGRQGYRCGYGTYASDCTVRPKRTRYLDQSSDHWRFHHVSLHTTSQNISRLLSKPTCSSWQTYVGQIESAALLRWTSTRRPALWHWPSRSASRTSWLEQQCGQDGNQVTRPAPDFYTIYERRHAARCALSPLSCKCNERSFSLSVYRVCCNFRRGVTPIRPTPSIHVSGAQNW